MMNKNQKEAVSHVNGPMIVIAGPGSGKTHVLTNRIANLIDAEQVEPSRILVITFSKAAAVEMDARFKKLRESRREDVSFSTFHSLFLRILRETCGVGVDAVVTEMERIKIIEGISASRNIYIDEDGIKTALRLISNIKNAIDLKSLCNSTRFKSDLPCTEAEFNEIYQLYNKTLRSAEKLDFDDMVQRCYRLFLSNPSALKKYQEKFDYVLIDEFQDINEVQFAIIQMLVKPHSNLFVVGDDDQSIYGFLGSRPEIMLSFRNEFHNAKMVVLDTNYRSHKAIVVHSQEVIKDNKVRYAKDVKINSDKSGEIKVREFDTDADQYLALMHDFLRFSEQSGRKLKDCCAIFRTGKHAGDFAATLAKREVPFIMKENVNSIYRSSIIKDLLSYLKLAHVGLHHDDFVSVMNKPTRYIKRKSIPKDPILKFRDLRVQNRNEIWVVDSLNDMEYYLNKIKKMDFSKGVDCIVNDMGYRKHITDFAIRYKKDIEDIWDMVDTFKKRIADFYAYEEILEHIASYEEMLKKAKKNDGDGINIMTMHASKGLEFPYVVVANCNESIIPHKKAIDVEEERRLLYVAMTRAEEKLDLSYCKNIGDKSLDISPLIGKFHSLIIKN